MLNKKAYISGGIVFFIVLILIIIIGGVIYYMDFFGIKGKIKEKVNFDKFGSVVNNMRKSTEEFQPQSVLSWCSSKLVGVSTNQYDPQEINIIGEDNTQEKNCCVYEYKGISACLNKSIIVQTCITSQIGGSLLYLKLNDRFKPTHLYKEAIEDLNSFNIENYNRESCLTELYG